MKKKYFLVFFALLTACSILPKDPPEVVLAKALSKAQTLDEESLETVKCFRLKEASIEIPKASLAEKIYCNKTFCSQYSVEKKAPYWVAVATTKDRLNSKTVVRKDQFHEDKCPKTASTAPFKGTQFDLGHLWPAEDVRYSAESMYESGSMLNITAQPRTFNRGLWAQIEKYVRQREASSAKRSWIVSGPVDLKSEEKLKDIVIPKRYFKAVLSEAEDGTLGTYGFIVAVGNKGSVANFRASIDEIEKETGYDFFALLPDEFEEKVEATFSEPTKIKVKADK